MTYSSTHDEFLATDRTMDIKALAPFQFREDKDEKGTLEWLTQNFDNMEKTSHSRRITYRRYQAMYKNIQWKNFDARDTRRDSETLTRRPRQSVNFVREMVDARVAQNSRMKHNLAFIPSHDQASDTANAKLCKIMYDGYSEENDLEKSHMMQDKVTFTFGHSLMWIDWDPEMGPYSPRYLELKESYQGEIPKDIKKKFKGKKIKVGDVRTEVLGPDRFYVEKDKARWCDIDHVERIDYEHIECLKAKYPKKKNDIRENEREIYSFDNSEMVKPKDMIVVRTFFHRPTQYFPEGCKIVYTDDCILEWVDFPYEHGELPAVPDKDVEVYGEFFGRSFLMDIEQLQRYYNAIQSAQARDFSWASAPKWMVPKGSTNVHSLSNDITIVEFSGPMSPQLVTPNYTPPASIELQDRIESKISKHSNVHDISRGDTPSGVTANSALRFLDEQESQVIAPQEAKRKRRVISVARMILQLMKQYYKPGDGRTVRMLGEKNQYLYRSMDKADFGRVHDVKVQNTSALPDTKTGKIAAVVDLNAATQKDPIFRKEEIVQMLDLGNDEYFKDRATVAVDTANTAFDSLLEGERVAPPSPADELLVHYSVFSKGLQSFTYRERTDEEVKMMMEMHVKALELLMFERAKVNLKFCTQLLELDNYPMFFKPLIPITKVMAMHQMDAQGGQGMEMGGTAPMETQKMERMPELAANEQE